ncbi:hypothetical protein SUDANB1_05590 [Streptomyces sp. enrichment culture]
MLGLACGLVAGAVTWAIEPVRAWWWAVALVVAVLVWTRGRFDAGDVLS